MAPRPAASLWNVLEMQVLWPHSKLIESASGALEPVLSQASSDSDICSILRTSDLEPSTKRMQAIEPDGGSDRKALAL